MASGFETGRHGAAAERRVSQLLTIEQLMEVGAPTWQLKPLFEVGALVVLYGPPGEGKTFTALDWALCVATGRSWMELQVAQGPVIYIVGEGGGGVRKRVQAWRRAAGLTEIPDVLFRLVAVQLLDEGDVDVLRAELADQGVTPALIVFDTMARCFVDGDENQARDIGRLVHSARRLQQETRATVLLVHHTGKQSQSTERGSNALRGAADVMILQRQDSRGVITISNNKQKDHGEFKPITARLKVIDMGVDADGEPMTSCVLVPSQGAQTVPVAGAARRALAALAACPDGRASSAEWRTALAAESGSSAVPDKTFHNWRKALLAAGLIEELTDHRSHYQVTDRGRDAAGVPAQAKVGKKGGRDPWAAATAKALP